MCSREEVVLATEGSRRSALFVLIVSLDCIGDV